MTAREEVRAHLLAVIAEFDRIGVSVVASVEVGVGGSGVLRFHPMLEARQLAIEEIAWAREELRAGPSGSVTELLVGYWFLLLQVQLKTDAMLADFPEPDPDASPAGHAVGEMVRFRIDVDRLIPEAE